VPVAAPLIVAAGTIGGGLLASHSASKAATTAATAQTQAADQGIAAQQAQFATTNANLAPYRDFGASALGPMGDLLGLNGNDAAGTAIAGLKDSPLYKSLFSNGQNTVLANASATGGLRGGNTENSLADFGRDTLSTVIENQLNRLTGAAGIGENAAAQTGTFGAHSADAIAQLLGDQGSAQAGSALLQGAAGVNSANTIASALAQFANNNKVQTAVGKLF
jgi:hypothetical protein